MPMLVTEGKSPADRRARLHARMASVSRNFSLSEPLIEELLTGRVTYVLPIREVLDPWAPQIKERLKRILNDDKDDPQHRFRAALALALYLPSTDESTWTDSIRSFLAQQLVSSNSEFQPILREALKPIQGILLNHLERIFIDTTATDTERLGAANAMVEFASNDIEKLSELLALATPAQHAVLYPEVVAAKSQVSLARLRNIAASLPTEENDVDCRIRIGKKRANALATMIKMGEQQNLSLGFEWNDDPESLFQFIFSCKPLGVQVESLLDLLDVVAAAHSDEYHRDVKYALLLAIGEYGKEDIPGERLESLVRRLTDWYANDPSSSVHGASGWLLRHFGKSEIAERIERIPVAYSPEREWFTLEVRVRPNQQDEIDVGKNNESDLRSESTANAEDTEHSDNISSRDHNSSVGELKTKSHFYTFIVCDVGEKVVGSPDSESERKVDEKMHPVEITRRYALLDREVSLEELIDFSPKYLGLLERPGSRRTDAGFGVDWYDSVGFCRWLSREFGYSDADQCYLNPEALSKDLYPRDPEVSWAPISWPCRFEKRGFRLPTEVEWESAIRNGAKSAYFFGNDVSLLNRFGWFVGNSGNKPHASRELRPSLRGMFDVHGNLFEWTYDWFGDYAELPLLNPVNISIAEGRVRRGGGWGNYASVCRSASRSFSAPKDRLSIYGFRLALTLPTEMDNEDQFLNSYNGIGSHGFVGSFDSISE